MKLPNNKNSIIAREKLTDYILSETHVTGKFKAKFFGKMGFHETNVNILEQCLRNLAETEDVREVIETLYGIKFVIDGEIKAPSGKIAIVRTIWIIEKGEQKPRFITVYPV